MDLEIIFCKGHITVQQKGFTEGMISLLTNQIVSLIIH